MCPFRLSTYIGNRRPLRKPQKHLQEIADWAASFEGTFPECNDPSDLCEHWHLPADERLVDPPTAAREHQACALQYLLDAAAHLRAARPGTHSHQRVYALISWPRPSGAEVGVFLDPDYGAGFERRTHPSQLWTPVDAEARSLARELGLEVPEGFVEAGYYERCEDEDPDAPDGVSVFEREIWMIREPLAG